jgi:hypothetical protein
VSRRSLPLLAVLALIVTGCGSAVMTSTAAPASTQASGCDTIDPHNAFGQTVCITKDGLRPAWLVSTIGHPVSWRNETHATVKVVFDAVEGGPGTIPPGGTWDWSPPNPESVSYHVLAGARLHGVVEADPPSQ